MVKSIQYVSVIRGVPKKLMACMSAFEFRIKRISKIRQHLNVSNYLDISLLSTVMYQLRVSYM